MSKKYFFIFLLCFSSSSIFSQISSNECIENYSLYREFVKIEHFDFAFPYWKEIFEQCPDYNKNLYIDGAKIYKNLIEASKDEALKQKYLDTLLFVYNQRIEYFDEKGFVYGKIGCDLLKYSYNSENQIQALEYLEKSIEIEKNATDEKVLFSLFSVSYNLFLAKELELKKFLNNYLAVFSIAKYISQLDISNDNCIKIANYVDTKFYATDFNIDSLLICLEDIYYKEKNNPTIEIKIIEILNFHNISHENDFFYLIIENFKTKQNSREISNLYFEIKEYDLSEEYMKKAIEEISNNHILNELYLELAEIQLEQNKYSEAEKSVFESLKTTENYGKAYILLAKIYVQSKNYYDFDDFEKYAIYWIAVDKLEKAKNVDETVIEEADALINCYSKYFPSKEIGFWNSLYEGDKYIFKNWFTDCTKVRFL